jgi:hypothetical protein
MMSRRVSSAHYGAGYIYFRLSGGAAALAAYRLVSLHQFVQFCTVIGSVMFGAAPIAGARVRVWVVFSVWFRTNFLPSFGVCRDIAAVFAGGPFGIGWLCALKALFRDRGDCPFVHALFWSMFLNVGVHNRVDPDLWNVWGAIRQQ